MPSRIRTPQARDEPEKFVHASPGAVAMQIDRLNDVAQPRPRRPIRAEIVGAAVRSDGIAEIFVLLNPATDLKNFSRPRSRLRSTD